MPDLVSGGGMAKVRIIDTLERYEKVVQEYYQKLEVIDPLPTINQHLGSNAMYQMVHQQLYVASRVASFGSRGMFVFAFLCNTPYILGRMASEKDSLCRELYEVLLYFNFSVPYAMSIFSLRIETYLKNNCPAK